ncbi:DsbA family protein [Streptomyces sp. NPDC094038]|uniref:DsbA family oxidoreductase n=1 Tax=Streptomyces sp. NPDC094038 TaxID=3366055 RepID=UPI0038190550
MTGGQAVPPVEVVEYTDPLCPWAWGSEPVFRGLRTALAGRVRWRRVFCILFDHDDDPAPDPAAETAWYARYVEGIAGHTRAPRALRLSRVAASSWPSSLVAKAAELQGPEVADRVLRRLRETVFVLGEPADTLGAALDAATGVPGLDTRRLAADAASAAVLDGVRADHAEARRPVPEVLPDALSEALSDTLSDPPSGALSGVLSLPGGSPHPGTARETPDGGHRYALPTLVVCGAGGRRVVPGWRPYEVYATAVGAFCPGLPTTPQAPSGAAALARYRSLTEPERALLTRGAWPPPDAVRVETAGGPLWLDPEEADTHPATRQTP